MANRLMSTEAFRTDSRILICVDRRSCPSAGAQVFPHHHPRCHGTSASRHASALLGLVGPSSAASIDSCVASVGLICRDIRRAVRFALVSVRRQASVRFGIRLQS